MGFIANRITSTGTFYTNGIDEVNIGISSPTALVLSYDASSPASTNNRYDASGNYVWSDLSNSNKDLVIPTLLNKVYWSNTNSGVIVFSATTTASVLCTVTNVESFEAREFSIELWANITPQTGTPPQFVFLKLNDVKNSFGTISYPQWTFNGTFSGNTTSVTGNTTYGWNHVVLTRINSGGSAVFKLFQNGVMVGTPSSSIASSVIFNGTSTTLTLSINTLTTLLSSLRLYNRELSPNEIKSNYNLKAANFGLSTITGVTNFNTTTNVIKITTSSVVSKLLDEAVIPANSTTVVQYTNTGSIRAQQFDEWSVFYGTTSTSFIQPQFSFDSRDYYSPLGAFGWLPNKETTGTALVSTSTTVVSNYYSNQILTFYSTTASVTIPNQPAFGSDEFTLEAWWNPVSFPAIRAGQSAYTTPGTYSWTAPTKITSVSVVCVGGGGGGGKGFGYNGISSTGGGGGALGWTNSVPVTPGSSYTVVVGAGGSPGGFGAGTAGGDSYFISTSTVKGGGGGASRSDSLGGLGGTYYAVAGYGTFGGGNGGDAGDTGGANFTGVGGGGAGGYTGAGGRGGNAGNNAGASGTGGGGGGGGGGNYTSAGGSGGGVGILGQGTNGAGGAGNSLGAGGGGSGGTTPTTPTGGSSANAFTGGLYGGGGGGVDYNNGGETGGTGGAGAVRIMWGAGRAYPSTSVADMTVALTPLEFGDTLMYFSDSSNNTMMIARPTDAAWAFLTTGTNNIRLTGYSASILKTWTHTVITKRNSGTNVILSWYQNGALLTATTFAGLASTNLNTGTMTCTLNSGTNLAIGAVNVYKSVISAGDIANLYASGRGRYGL